MAMTLMDFVSNRAGTWSAAQGSRLNNLIELCQWDDAVTFQGPLHLNVAVVAQNVLTPLLSGGAARNSVNELYSYDLEIPAGYSWQYQMSESPAASRLLPAYKVIIRTSPCARVPVVQPPDLPCDFAVGNLPCVGEFFPVGCEPCGSGPVRMPPTCGPSLTVKPASGGCIRPRFFNGMFITREDLETELRYLRIKNKLQRRADGQGVVWGLGIRRQGSAVCVQPGYALDCCGNDLTVTSMYTVDSATLLSDPAICNQVTGRQCHCASICSSNTSSAPRNRGPSTATLVTVPPPHARCPAFARRSVCAWFRRAITSRPARSRPFSARLLPPRQRPAALLPGQGPAQPPHTRFPKFRSPSKFLIMTTVIPVNFLDTTTPATFTPPVSLTDLGPQPVARADREAFGFNDLTIAIVPDSNFLFTAGTLNVLQTAGDGVTAPATVDLTNQPDGSSRFTLPPTPITEEEGSLATYQMSWQGTLKIAGQTVSVKSQTQIQETIAFPPFGGEPVEYLDVSTLSIEATASITPFPCLNDACCANKPLFPVFPPWADDNPLDPGHTADPKVLALALVYALYAGVAAQEGSSDAKVQLAAELFQAVAALLDPKARRDSAELSKVTQAVQQLFNDWCCSFLYPGPTCDGEPHGVVIGCATIASGQIESISPWSGRRWVMHYPLVSYWGAQFGIVPPDVLASRLFSLICCLGSLPIPGIAVFNAAGRSNASKEVAVGAGFLRIASAPSTQSATSSSAQNPSQSLDLASFAARILSTLARPAAPAGTADV